MSRNTENGKKGSVGGELKYCEHCGGLFVREKGAGVVYCEKCQAKVADLPIPKKKTPGRVLLPVRQRTVVEKYGTEPESDPSDLEAVGGVA
jgi:ribosomal protein L37AE/L43A